MSARIAAVANSRAELLGVKAAALAEKQLGLRNSIVVTGFAIVCGGLLAGYLTSGSVQRDESMLVHQFEARLRCADMRGVRRVLVDAFDKASANNEIARGNPGCAVTAMTLVKTYESHGEVLDAEGTAATEGYRSIVSPVASLALRATLASGKH